MASSPLPPGLTDVRPLAPPPGTVVPPVREALAAPYTLERWREDLRALAAGVPTGVDALDDLGLSWLPGKLYALASRPGGGKTTLLLELVLRYLEAHPTATALFLSWEEPLAELVLRLVLREDANAVRAGAGFGATPLHRPTVRAWGRGEDLPLGVPSGAGTRLAAAGAVLAPTLERLRLIDGDALGRNAHAVLRDVAAWMRDSGAARPGIVAVDYFQKLRGGGVYPSRQAELQAVSDLLRRFAKGARLTGADDAGEVDVPDPAYAVPVLVGAQVTRGGGDHPTGDQIREADDLLNDAAGVVTLSWEDHGGDADDPVRALRVAVPKNRDGRTRTDEVARLTWHPARAWLDRGALRDGATGKVRWATLAPATDPSTDRAPRARPVNGAQPTAQRVLD